jgi:dipeptidyl aminopeptidase/acylaminoacyl peptidase
VVSDNFILLFNLRERLLHRNRWSVVIICLLGCSDLTFAAQTQKPFTLADDIGISLIIGDGSEPCVRFSPNGEYFAVYSERGRVDVNQVEDSLRFYRTLDIENFLANSDPSRLPLPVWVVSRSAKDAGESGEGVIQDWHWLRNSSGVAFLERLAEGNSQLVLADLEKKTEALTSTAENVHQFDVRDRNHYVYTASQPKPKTQAERQELAIVGTGRDLNELIFPDDPSSAHGTASLWAVIDGKRFQVQHGGEPIVPNDDLALSPDGRSVVSKMTIHDIPSSWETVYPPPYPSEAHRIHAGGSAGQYVLIELQTGEVHPLTDAPTSIDAGWDVLGGPDWSSDGAEIVLPGTFIKSKDNAPSRPCVAVIDIVSNTRHCVEILKARTETGVEEGFHRIFAVRFAPGDRKRLLVTFQKHGEDWFSLGTTEYRRTAEGAWQPSSQSDGMPEFGHENLAVTVKQAFNQPPLVVASSKAASRLIWDPNPQLKQIALSDGSLYTWKDKDGRPLKGGLFKPPDYKPGQRYPLVIQTHGFDGEFFMPTGSFPTAFTAGELAAVGIMVLQSVDGADGCGSAVTPQEGPCAVSAYESAAKQLVSDGMVDPERIGIIGFSRSCYYVMETLTTSSLHFKAASITDGIMLDYFQYMQNPDRMLGEGNAMVGAPPFGEGLQLWLKRSPGFNLDKVNAPLRVVGRGRSGVLDMWAPYAGLHYLKKPVELIMLNSPDHVLSNPAERMTAQGGTVDWFRFWLQDYEDPDPAKADQYKRWRELKKMRAENEKKSATSQASLN